MNTKYGRSGRKLASPAAETPMAAATAGPAQQSAEPNAAAMALLVKTKYRPVTLMIARMLP